MTNPKHAANEARSQWGCHFARVNRTTSTTSAQVSTKTVTMYDQPAVAQHVNPDPDAAPPGQYFRLPLTIRASHETRSTERRASFCAERRRHASDPERGNEREDRLAVTLPARGLSGSRSTLKRDPDAGTVFGMTDDVPIPAGHDSRCKGRSQPKSRGSMRPTRLTRR
jgi:hypothetical protein